MIVKKPGVGFDGALYTVRGTNVNTVNCVSQLVENEPTRDNPLYYGVRCLFIFRMVDRMHAKNQVEQFVRISSELYNSNCGYMN